MKIERVNDHQIRCTLTRDDLAKRDLKITELAYGTDKAKELFQDMMQQANIEFGFEAEDTPLMIEAIPINSECIVLIITKVEDPDELDARFSKFAPGVHDEEDDFEEDDEEEFDSPSDETGISDLFKRFKDALEQKSKELSSSDVKIEGMAFSFDSMAEVSKVSRSIRNVYCDESRLYLDKESGKYLLILKRGKMDMLDFIKVCNLVSEFGGPMHGSKLGEAFLEEHFEAICPKDAVEIAASL